MTSKWNKITCCHVFLEKVAEHRKYTTRFTSRSLSTHEHTMRKIDWSYRLSHKLHSGPLTPIKHTQLPTGSQMMTGALTSVSVRVSSLLCWKKTTASLQRFQSICFSLIKHCQQVHTRPDMVMRELLQQLWRRCMSLCVLTSSYAKQNRANPKHDLQSAKWCPAR